MLRVACPHCSAALSLPVSVGGTSVQCPHCAKWFAVAKVVVPPPRPSEPRQVEVSLRSSRTTQSDLYVWLVIGGVVAFVGAGLPIISLIWHHLTK